MKFIEVLLDNVYFQSVVSGVIGGLIVYGLQKLNDKKDRHKEKIEKSIVGRKELKILSQDFLYQYEPGRVTIEKLIEDFGQPLKRHRSNEYENLMFEFQNAKLEVMSSIMYNHIVCLTVFSKLDNRYPINCRLSFEEDEEVLGKAKISHVIIDNHFVFESYGTQLGYETIIGSFNAYRQTKHLKYIYLIRGQFDNVQETKNEIINQVCVTESEDVYSFFSFYDTFYG